MLQGYAQKKKLRCVREGKKENHVDVRREVDTCVHAFNRLITQLVNEKKNRGKGNRVQREKHTRVDSQFPLTQTTKFDGLISHIRWGRRTK